MSRISQEIVKTISWTASFIVEDPGRGMGACVSCLENEKVVQGYDNWEIFGIPDYFECIKCLEERTKNRPVPEEWRMPDE